MHPRLQEVQFLDSKGKPLPARQCEVVGEAFSAWFEEKILPRLDGTSGPIVGFLRAISRDVQDGTRFGVQLIAHGEILDEWMEGWFEAGTTTGRAARGKVPTRRAEYRSRWLSSKVEAGVQCLATGAVDRLRCEICGGEVLVKNQEIGWKVSCAAGCFEGYFHVVAEEGRESAIEPGMMLLSANVLSSSLQSPPFPWDRFGALLRPLQPLPVRHGSAEEVMKWSEAQPVREFVRRWEFKESQEDFQFLVNRALQAFVRSGLTTPFSAGEWEKENGKDSEVGTFKVWWRRLLGTGSGTGVAAVAGTNTRAIHANDFGERRSYSEGLPAVTTLECMELPDDRWIPALRELAFIVSALPIVIDGTALGESGTRGFAVLLKADECWLGADDERTRDHLTRLLRMAGIIEESKG
jgi:hypothetical protein